MKTYKALYQLAIDINEDWAAREAVNWSEAEQLVERCKAIDDLSALPEIKAIIAYSEANEDWDSGIVASWPDVIIDELECSDKQYTYEPENDDWRVFGVNLAGEEDWVATVSTETVAETLVKALSGIRIN